jgi:drug/metabolite transporter superfamily protein YnfA
MIGFAVAAGAGLGIAAVAAILWLRELLSTSLNWPDVPGLHALPFIRPKRQPDQPAVSASNAGAMLSMSGSTQGSHATQAPPPIEASLYGPSPTLQPLRSLAYGENPALTYRNLRAIIGYVGLTLPVVLLLSGIVNGHIEGSISAYYYTKVGIVFTGAMCVIGVFLVAYRVGSWALDSVVTTLAGVAAFGVAFFHTAPNNATLSQLRLSVVHLTCAAALFILLGGISLFIFPFKDVPQREQWRKYTYMAFGGLIWLSLILMPMLNAWARSFYDNNHVFFALETVCVIAFSVSFMIKGHGKLYDGSYNQHASSQIVVKPVAAAEAQGTLSAATPTTLRA